MSKLNNKNLESYGFDFLGYITKLYETIKKMNLKVIEHRLFNECENFNDLNPTGITIIKKAVNEESDEIISYQCPISKTNLERMGEVFYSKNSFLMYPIINQISLFNKARCNFSYKIS